MNPDPGLVELAQAKAIGLGLRPQLVCAIVTVESSWNPWAWNPEPRYRWLVDARTGRPFRPLTPDETASEYPPDDFYDRRGLHGRDADAEFWGQQASWGLMQVMGAVARERGFVGTYLTQLMDPPIGIHFGCQLLRSLLGRLRSEDAAIASFNGGTVGNQRPPYRNASYVSRVLAAEVEWQ